MLFALIAITAFFLVFIYTGLRLIVPAGLSKSMSFLSWFTLFLLSFFLPIVNFFFRIIDCPEKEILSWVAYTGLGFFSLIFTLLVIRDGIYFHRYIFKKIKKCHTQIDKTNNSSLIDRKQFLFNSISTGIMGVSGLLTGYGIYQAHRDPIIEKISIKLSNLPSNFEGFRIIQISDIHAGGTINQKFVQNIVKIVNNIRPDLIAITGDLVDGSVSNLRKHVSSLSEMKAKSGTFFVTGNHEYYSGVTSWVREIKRMGINVLLNEHEIIESGNQKILLAGVTDYNGKRFIKSQESSPKRAIEGSPPCDVKILLAHQPRSIYKAAEVGFDLQLSGHTHGGQYYPYKFFVYLQQPFINGLHKYKNTQIYINRGTGYWGPPLRIGIPSEITEITLVS